MAETEFNFQNILVINFGQMGDVILSLPALRAVRDKFTNAKITLLIGKPGAELIRISGVSDEQIVVDRVKMRDGNKFNSIADIVRLIREIRRNKFDLIIDLHSLSETNLLGFVSGAKYRLYSNRESRSLDSLGRFPTKPPREDKSKHHTDRYFDVLKPIGIVRSECNFQIEIPEEAKACVAQRFTAAGLDGKPVIGMSIGAGHPSRCWDLAKFDDLASRVLADPDNRVVVFLGPEEKEIGQKVRDIFPQNTTVFDDLTIPQLLAATSMLSVLVSNDSGPAHIGAIAGAPVLLVMDHRAPNTFLPLAGRLNIVNSSTLDQITVGEVADELAEMLEEIGR